jgi:2-polyprenyl-3-methyl-5-hydroxy-6-metoxy-1,4-benzoquinol methylase
MDNNLWWHPENLAKDEKNFRENLSDNDLNLNNDFGSYRKVLKTGKIKGSRLNLHNDLFPLIKLSAIDRIFGPFNPKSILDAGCGMGFTTKALKNIYKTASVLGVDVSMDAIEYAKKHQKGPIFINMAISPENKVIGFFDLIYCIEFYPFTRNTNIDFQVKFISYYISQLNPNGKLIVYQKWNNSNSLSAILSDIKLLLPDLDFNLKFIPHPKILRCSPIIISRIINKFFSLVLGRDLSKAVLIIEKKSF